MGSHKRVSIVIPAYNESLHLRDCLEAISRQTVLPYEVIVVDNNSTDNTVDIARQFPFVRVIQEKRQGVLFARATGYDAARGEIIGRIDVDTKVTPNWVATLIEIFNESDIAATSGKMLYDDVPMTNLLSRLELSFRRYLAFNFTYTNTVFLQGASMGLRRDAWRTIRSGLCERRDIHEDYDIALHLQQYGFRVTFDERLVAHVSLRRIDTSFREMLAYVRTNPHTYRVHNAPGRSHMYAVISVFFLAYVPLRLLYRSYDPATEKLSLRKIFQPGEARLNPFG